jgi:ubiquinone/menaquinone biosynthesis C-methylase UbiE
MELATAIELIRQGVTPEKPNAHWADLGCGDGLFTSALQSTLSADANILAIDKDRSSLDALRKRVVDHPSVETVNADFTEHTFRINSLDGILMANALHYVPDQVRFLTRLESYLSSGGVIVLVEYDLTSGNRWVPYPISKSALPQLVSTTPFVLSKILHEVPSVYHRSIYSALLTRSR